MKRSKMIKEISYFLEMYLDEPERHENTARHILDLVEKQGMLPPVNTCRLIPDPLRPGYHKHSETKREWDEEND